MYQKSPFLSGAFSFFLPGAGQVYCGKIGRGIAIFLVGLVLDLVAVFSFGLLGIAALFFWLWNIYDAYSLAGGGKSQPQEKGNSSPAERETVKKEG